MNLKDIIQTHINKFGSIKGFKSNKNKDALNKLDKLYPNISFPEQAYLLMNDLVNPPVCIDCECSVNFINYNKGYQQRCKTCGNKKSSETIKDQRKKEIIKIKQICKQCGNEFIRFTKNEKEITNHKVHFCSKTCATTYNQIHMSKETQSARISATKKTNKERYDNEYVINSEYARQKTFEKLGVKYAFQDISIVKKAQNTLEARTGYKYPGLNAKTIDKMIATKIKRYGDLLKPCYQYKDYAFPSGRIVKVQGFEDRVLDNLLLSYDENDLIVGRSEIEKYTNKLFYIINDKKHVYYPDIFIKSTKTIIEVKSDWTYNIWKEKNELKKQACLDAGFNFKFIIL